MENFYASWTKSHAKRRTEKTFPIDRYGSRGRRRRRDLAAAEAHFLHPEWRRRLRGGGGPTRDESATGRRRFDARSMLRSSRCRHENIQFTLFVCRSIDGVSQTSLESEEHKKEEGGSTEKRDFFSLSVTVLPSPSLNCRSLLPD